MAMSEFRKNGEIAVCAHAQYKIGQNSTEWLARREAASSCNAFTIAIFVSCLYVWTGANNSH